MHPDCTGFDREGGLLRGWSFKNQSVKRFHFYRANISGVAELSDMTIKSVSDAKIHETVHDVNKSTGVLVTIGERPVNEMSVYIFLESCNRGG